MFQLPHFFYSFKHWPKFNKSYNHIQEVVGAGKIKLHSVQDYCSKIKELVTDTNVIERKVKRECNGTERVHQYNF